MLYSLFISSFGFVRSYLVRENYSKAPNQIKLLNLCLSESLRSAPRCDVGGVWVFAIIIIIIRISTPIN